MHEHKFEKTLKVAIALTFTFFVVEFIGGLASGSLSLLGDAGHMFRDVFALFVSLSAINIAKRLPTKTRTFGYHRAEIFAAFINGVLLVAISAWISWQAYQRLFAPRHVESIIMLAVALIGLMVNIYVAFRLKGSHDINVKSAFLHVIGDMLSSMAVILAAAWIFFTGQTIIDPLLGMGIAVFILFSALSVMREAVYTLFEFTPRNIDFDEVIRDMEGVKGVNGVHNVHIWSLCSNLNVIDAHIFTSEPRTARIELMKREMKKRLEKYNIKHATLEFECEECIDNNKIKGVRR